MCPAGAPAMAGFTTRCLLPNPNSKGQIRGSEPRVAVGPANGEACPPVYDRASKRFPLAPSLRYSRLPRCPGVPRKQPAIVHPAGRGRPRAPARGGGAIEHVGHPFHPTRLRISRRNFPQRSLFCSGSCKRLNDDPGSIEGTRTHSASGALTRPERLSVQRARGPGGLFTGYSKWSRGRGSNPHPKRPLRSMTGAHEEPGVSPGGFPTVQVQSTKMSSRRGKLGRIVPPNPLARLRPTLCLGPCPRRHLLGVSLFSRHSPAAVSVNPRGKSPGMSSVCITARKSQKPRLRSGQHPRQTRKDLKVSGLP